MSVSKTDALPLGYTQKQYMTKYSNYKDYKLRKDLKKKIWLNIQIIKISHYEKI